MGVPLPSACMRVAQLLPWRVPWRHPPRPTPSCSARFALSLPSLAWPPCLIPLPHHLLPAWPDRLVARPACLPRLPAPPACPTCPPTDSSSLSDSLAAFIKAEKLPAFTEFSQETSSSIFGSGINHQVGGRAGGRAGVGGWGAAVSQHQEARSRQQAAGSRQQAAGSRQQALSLSMSLPRPPVHCLPAQPHPLACLPL